MPSTSLITWRGDGLTRLAVIERQCVAAMTLVPPDPLAVEETLRTFVLSLSAHFQGFCRDLYSECAQLITGRFRPALQSFLQAQCRTARRLDMGNPTLQNIVADFERFGFHLGLSSRDPANPVRITDLGHLNAWRNTAAHQGLPPRGVPALGLPVVLAWRSSCDGLGAFP